MNVPRKRHSNTSNGLKGSTIVSECLDEDDDDRGKGHRNNGRGNKPFSLNQVALIVLLGVVGLLVCTVVYPSVSKTYSSSSTDSASYRTTQSMRKAKKTSVSDDDEHIALPVLKKAGIYYDDDDERSEDEETEQGIQQPQHPLDPHPIDQMQKNSKKQAKQQPAVVQQNQAAKVAVIGNPLDQTYIDTDPDVPKIDFIVGGFPKCGTTTLLGAFLEHPDIAMEKEEMCKLICPVANDNIVLDKFSDFVLESLGDDPSKKKGFKCPETLRTHKTIHRLTRHSPHAKFIIGVRHPLSMLQSFYNYRVMEKFFHNQTDVIPSFTDLLQPTRPPWRGCSIDSNRYEIYLQQFGKTAMTVDDMRELERHQTLAVKPNKFQIFLFDTEQFSDKNETRNAQVRKDLQDFLGLPNPIPAFGVKNRNTLTYKEYVDICERRYENERKILLKNSRRTADWIANLFIESPDVVVSNRDHFLSILEEWKTDPCDQPKTAES